jgi:predicted Fe-S protein YdhL (DUF1289 family)
MPRDRDLVVRRTRCQACWLAYAQLRAMVPTVPHPNLAEPLSPCTGVCRLNEATRICRGCRRSLAEIAAWASLTPAEKHRVLDAITRRAPPDEAPDQ